MIYNQLEIDNIVQNYITKYDKGIKSVYNNYYKHDGSEFTSIFEELKEELKTGSITFVNKNNSIQGIDKYLFYITNDYIKKRHAISRSIKKKIEYICPGCLVNGSENVLHKMADLFKCTICNSKAKQFANDYRVSSFYKSFAIHSKSGYRCNDCSRFIPLPINNYETIVCPYLDCIFVGNISSMKKMNHPTINSNKEVIIKNLENVNICDQGVVVSNAQSQCSILLSKEDLKLKVNSIIDIIESQRDSVPYSGSDSTAKHKLLCYEAFKNLLIQYPNDMVDYLLNNSRSGGFQNKIFQEYITLLEKSIPYSYCKNNKIYRVESLLDTNLGIFDGISIFEAKVNSKLCVKNETKEFYIGGRKGAISQPYYLGKILSVNCVKTKKSLMNNIVEYSFSKIRMKDISPGTEVSVAHLRVPPHYQMGGMTYVNRIRKKIVERAKLVSSKNNEEN